MSKKNGDKDEVPAFFNVMVRKISWLLITDRDVPNLAKLLTLRHYNKGTVLRTAGEMEHDLFVIKEGKVEVSTPLGFGPSVYDGIQGQNFQFGGGIFQKHERKAMFTATASTDVAAWVLSRKHFLNFSKKARKRFVIASAPVHMKEHKSEPITPIDKKPEELTLIVEALKKCDLLSSLSDDMYDTLAKEMSRTTVADKAAIIQQGDRGDKFYILNKGSLQVKIDGEAVAEKKPGQFFGELALMHDGVRSATVTAKGACEVFEINSATVRKVVARHAFKENTQRAVFLRKVPLLHSLKPDQLSYIAEAMSEQSYLAGEAVVRQGDDGDQFFIVKSGELEITVKYEGDSDDGVAMGNYKAGDYFGELALLNDAKRAATVTAKGVCICLSLKKQDFAQILGQAQIDLLAAKNQEYKNRVASTPRHRSKTSEMPRLMETVSEPNVLKPMAGGMYKSLADFEILGTLGRGAFGHVRLVRDKKESKVHALKTLNKHLLVETEQVEHVHNELGVMSCLKSPFVIEFRGWFQDQNHIHLVMQQCLGGELGTLLEEKETFSEDEAMFSTACIVLGFEHLHGLGIVFRDLKPENLLLEPSGYLKMVDFGFAKKIDAERTFTLCGTPEYLSPEVIQGQGHGYATDFWSLGILLFEVLTGETPFYDSNPMATYQVIMRSKGVPWPDDVEVSDGAKACCEALLNKQAPMRLGATGTQGIKEHSWFADIGFSWDQMLARTFKSPFKMEVSGEVDMSRFSDYMGEDERWQDFDPGDQPDPFKDCRTPILSGSSSRTTQRPPGYVAHNISRDPGLVDCTVDLCGHIGLHSPSPLPQCG
eukprot:g355.t1